MDYSFLSKIRASINLYTKKKTSNVLDGSFRSIYRGRSMDFDDLREYSYGDNIKDIDWKSSSKAGKLLVRRYIAEKKHNILFLCDSGSKFDADTSRGQSKKMIAEEILGTLIYLVDKHTDDYALMYSKDHGVDFTYFKSGMNHMEDIFTRYTKQVTKDAKRSVKELVDYTIKNIHRRMLVFIITDMEGLSQIEEKQLKVLSIHNDIFIINIDDAYMTGGEVYDREKNEYVDDMIAHNKKLHRLEVEDRKQRLEGYRELFTKYQTKFTTISCEDEVVKNIVQLFENDELK